MRRVERLQEQLADARGGRVVYLSHCLLNENVRYLGGAGRVGGVGEVAGGYLARGVGICQLPCPEQRAWGGALKRRMLVAYGSAGTLRAPVARLLLRPFTWYTRWVYARLARAITRDVADTDAAAQRWSAWWASEAHPHAGWPPPWICPEPSTRLPAARPPG